MESGTAREQGRDIKEYVRGKNIKENEIIVTEKGRRGRKRGAEYGGQRKSAIAGEQNSGGKEKRMYNERRQGKSGNNNS